MPVITRVGSENDVWKVKPETFHNFPNSKEDLVTFGVYAPW